MANTRHIVVGGGEGQHFSVLDGVVRDLCSLEVLNGRYLIQMPTATAFGSLVSVSVWPEGNGETFLVSDDGAAYQEASNACASERTFSSVARSRCERYGASFDGRTMLFIRVGADRLRGAIIAMAALVKEVVDETIEKSFNRKLSNARERFVKRVSEAFPGYETFEGAIVIGGSTASYDFDILVQSERVALAFDFFSKAGNSVNSAYAKLSDVGRLDNGPKPVGVTPSLKSIGPKLTLISSVARVIEADAPESAYRRLAA